MREDSYIDRRNEPADTIITTLRIAAGGELILSLSVKVKCVPLTHNELI